MTENGTVTGGEVLDAIASATDLPAYVEMTGGGVATIYIGHAGPDGRFTLAGGPGSFRWADDGRASIFYFEDFSFGPDDDGDSDLWKNVTTLADVAPAVRELLLALDPRFVDVLVPCGACGAAGAHDEGCPAVTS